MKKVAVVDIETTGFQPSNSLILEIGIVELDVETGEVKEIFNSCVKEPSFGTAHRRSWIFDHSDLQYDEILKAPSLEEIRKDVQDILDKYSITAFNKQFDLGFLRARGFNIPNELPCIMFESTNVCLIPSRNSRSKYKKPKVQEAWDHFFPNSDYIEGHRALDDADHEAKILYELIRTGNYPL